MILGIQAMRHMPAEWRTKRSREELAVWVRHGHSEAEIRALVKARTVVAKEQADEIRGKGGRKSASNR